MTTLFAREAQQYEAVGLEEGELPAEAEEIELSGGVAVTPDANPATPPVAVASAATADAAGATTATASPAPKPCPSPRLPDEPMLEVVKFLDIKGKTWEMADVPLRWSVAELKMAVEGDTGCEVDRQRLIYGGKVLKDDQTVEESKVQSHTVIHLFQRPPKAALPVASAVPAGASVTNPLHSGVADGVVAVAAGGSGAVGVAVDGAAGNDADPDPSLAFLHDMEVVEARRRVRLLASILLLISGLNVVTDFVELVNFVFKGTMAELLRLVFRLCVNVLGVYVGTNGVKASQTLNEQAVFKYVWGLVVVGMLYISNDLWMLITVATAAPDGPEAPVPEPTSAHSDDEYSPNAGWDDDVGADPNQPDAISTDDAAEFTPSQATLVNQASMSLLISVMIWTLCFYRAFALRRAVRERIPR